MQKLAGDYPLINRLGQGASAEELGGKLSHVLADDLRIYRRDALRLVEEATDLGPRRALIGEPLAPRLEYTAAGQREGRVGAEHVGIIRTFLAHLPCWVDEAKRADAERIWPKPPAGTDPINSSSWPITSTCV